MLTIAESCAFGGVTAVGVKVMKMEHFEYAVS
jgi:hypothetical protein